MLCDNRSCVHRGRPWRNSMDKRLVCLVKVAEGHNEVAEGLGAVGQAVPLGDEAQAMLEAVGWQELPTGGSAGAMRLGTAA